MNTPVSFQMAELLKEKGFDDFTQIWYQHGEGISGCVEGKRDYYNRKGDVYTSAPTISDVVMWLYEKHGIWIGVYDLDDTTIFRHCFSNIDFNSPTEAYEAAIEYTLNNLI